MRTVGLLLMSMVTLLAGSAKATDYYVSTTGSNSNVGTSSASPFLTIQQAANVAQAGDNVYVCGGTYRETVTMPRSGTAGAPIVFQPYRNEQVTITGLDIISGGWSASGSNYQNTVTGGVSQLFVDGKMMSEARSANSGYTNPLRRAFNTVTSAANLPASSTITSSSLDNPSDGDWNGAKMAIASGRRWVAFNGSVVNQTGNSLNVVWSDSNQYGSVGMSGNPYYAPESGNPFYLYGSRAAVDSAKEYYYDAGNSVLYFNSAANPNTRTVEVRRRELGFDLNSQSCINVRGFRFKAANINIAGNNNLIDDNQILYPKPFTDEGGWNTTSGVMVSGHNNTLINSEVAYSWGSGVTVTGSSNTISNNVVHDVNWYGNDASAIDISNSNNSAVVNNTMYNAGRSGLLNRMAGSATITHNEIARYGFLTTDLGGTYCYMTDGNGTTIAYNHIRDSYVAGGSAAGIYLDDESANFTVHHNTVSNAAVGVMNKGAHHDVYNNTLVNISYGAVFSSGVQQANCNTYNNLSNKSTFDGTSTGTNIYTTTDQFVNAAAGDYTLKSTSSAIDAGTVIPGVTDGYVGLAPDVGAFEHGATPWTAGASFKTWLFANQTALPLTAAANVSFAGIRTTAGSLIAGRTGNSASTNNRSFFKFDLSGVSGPIQSAVVRIYENAAPILATEGVSLYAVTSSWDPESVSYNQGIAPLGTPFYDPDNLELYTDIDVTSIVQGWIDNPSSNHGFSLRGDAENVDYSAKYFEGMYGVTLPLLVIAVPEPRSLALVLTGVLGLLGCTRRSREQ
jgi:hypothetical protein